ncbi:hypothetical protein CVT25_005121 [Psilocybe cyanescens]|uniref:Uncharacterized protein n=1 Tax=Psilocybe cyanescens TaxID=93625 RepID=A0A409W7W1_PSICY|nr:hypothetical protein CVT25_005121 [Psilocybe cyanescens]
MELSDNLDIEEVTTEAFRCLGNKGVIKVGMQHSCSECTQKYKHVADNITLANEDLAAVVGQDEHPQINMIMHIINELIIHKHVNN